MSNRQPRPIPAPAISLANRQPQPGARPALAAGEDSEGQGAWRICLWCNAPMLDQSYARGGQRRRFCSASCRTLAHRQKSRLITPAAAQVLDCSVEVAERMLGEKGVSGLAALLSAAGVVFDPRRRSFVDLTGRSLFSSVDGQCSN